MDSYRYVMHLRFINVSTSLGNFSTIFWAVCIGIGVQQWSGPFWTWLLLADHGTWSVKRIVSDRVSGSKEYALTVNVSCKTLHLHCDFSTVMQTLTLETDAADKLAPQGSSIAW